MTIEISDLVPKYQTDAIRLGAIISHEPDEPDSIHVKLLNCRAYIREQYVKIRDQNHNVMILDRFDFSRISIF